MEKKIKINIYVYEAYWKIFISYFLFFPVSIILTNMSMQIFKRIRQPL